MSSVHFGAFSELRRELSATALDLPEIHLAGRRIANLGGGSTDDVPTQKMAVLGSLTTDFLMSAIGCAAVQEGILPILYQAPFGSYVQQVLDRHSELHRFRPDVVILAPDWRELVEDLPINTSADEVARLVDSKVGHFTALWDVISNEIGAKIIQNILIAPARRLRGVAERLSPASQQNQIRAITAALLERGRGRVAWVELDRLAARLGTASFADESGYTNAKLPFSLKFLPDYIPAFRAAWRIAVARTKKVLVVDLDNTVWGGVIGDEGVDGIVIGPGSPRGEAFADWGRYIKQLADRGVILAVCSKNDPKVAATGFTHKHSVLKKSDFAAFSCSWSDKAGELRRIAGELNVGVDSFVFVDDNPAECEQVRMELPEVAVVHLGTDPTRFIECVERGQWFDLDQYTVEDAARSEAYAARAQAREEQASSSDIATYLTGLRMVGLFGEAQANDLARVTQLEQKTNQFNVTTRRYSEGAISDFMSRDDVLVLAFKLSDKFGDHGLVSTLIAVHEGNTFRIDSWLMSCRIFSRTAEQFMLGKLIEFARARGATIVFGEYIPTEKNGVVANIYDRLGFERVTANSSWKLELADDLDGDRLKHFITESAESA